ncbi:MAG TPA: hypothetical protein VG962_14305 [Steroidobacteraceae bacterium]|nr:hypothetical protein [Steroidobacteraceae bacterium]
MSSKKFRNRNVVNFNGIGLGPQGFPLKLNRANPRCFLAYILYRFWLYQRSKPDAVAPFFFSFATLVLTINFAIMATALFIEAWTEAGLFSALIAHHFDRSETGMLGLLIVGVIWAVLHYVLLYKDRYVVWFEVFATETDRERVRGTVIVWSYLAFIALMVVTSITTYDVRHGQSMFL